MKTETAKRAGEILQTIEQMKNLRDDMQDKKANNFPFCFFQSSAVIPPNNIHYFEHAADLLIDQLTAELESL